MGENSTCWVCDAVKPIEDMVFSYDRHICSTLECLLGAFEMMAEANEQLNGKLCACK